MLRRNRVEIDLNAIRNNYRVLRESLPGKTWIMPVVKANAYGHGILETARALAGEGADCFAVALPEEGIELRLGGLDTAEILVLGAAMPGAAAACVEYGLTQTIFSAEVIPVLEKEAARQAREALVHIKLDTGMNRIGLKSCEEALALQKALEAAPHVHVTGLYTHFADADHLTDDGKPQRFTQTQMQRLEELRSCFDPATACHAANSAMSLLAPEAWLDGVREGIALYGYPPVPTGLLFRRALSWLTEVVHVKEIEAGESVGYGCAYTADRKMRIATVAVGYGDGYHRSLSGKGMMLIRGRRVPIVGRVCMDQTMVDVTDVPDVCVGDEAVLIGSQGSETIGADDVAVWADTISYEVLTSILPRVHRIYLGE